MLTELNKSLLENKEKQRKKQKWEKLLQEARQELFDQERKVEEAHRQLQNEQSDVNR